MLSFVYEQLTRLHEIYTLVTMQRSRHMALFSFTAIMTSSTLIDHRNNLRFRAARWLPLALLIVLALLPLWRILIGGVFLPLDIVPHQQPWRFSFERVGINNAANSDLVQQIYPRRLLANTFIKQGAWPLWNPTIMTGTPLLADGQLALFYPFSLIFLLTPLAYAFGIYTFVQLVLAALGTFCFARRLALGDGAALMASISYMFSGFLLTWLQFPEFSGAMAMLPWCFWAVDRACAARSVGAWLLAALILALPLVTQIQLAFYIYVGVGLYVVAHLIDQHTWRDRLVIVLGFGGAVLIAVALSAAQLLPQLMLSAEGQRAAQSTEPLSAELQFTNLLRLLLPLIGGEPRTAAVRWGPTLIEAPQPYAGIAPLLLAMIALLVSRHRRSTLFGVLAIGSFALALRTPLLDLFLLLVPPYRQFADHNRWFALWGFAVAILAGMAVQAFVQRDQLTTRSERLILLCNRALLLATLATIAVFGLWHLALFTPTSRYGAYITVIRQQPIGAALVFGALSLLSIGLLAIRRVARAARIGVLLTVATADLLWYGGTFNTTTDTSIFKPTTDLVAGLQAQGVQSPTNETLYPLSQQIAFLQAQPGPFRIHGGDYPVFLPNLATTFGVEDVRGYQSLYLARYNRLARLIDGRDYTQLAGEGGSSLRPYLTNAYTHRRLLDMLNVEYILFPPGSSNPPLYEPLELVQQSDEGAIYRNPNALPRAWLVHNATVIADDNQQLARMAAADFDPATTAIVSEAPPELVQPTTEERVEAIEYGPNELTVRATASASAMLIVSDAYTDDWYVSVDGAPARLYRANYALRGVWLPAGAHEIRFTYRPQAFVIGGWISLLTLLTISGYALWQWHVQRTTR